MSRHEAVEYIRTESIQSVAEDMEDARAREHDELAFALEQDDLLTRQFSQERAA